jgi:hypothetical protein
MEERDRGYYWVENKTRDTPDDIGYWNGYNFSFIGNDHGDDDSFNVLAGPLRPPVSKMRRHQERNRLKAKVNSERKPSTADDYFRAYHELDTMRTYYAIHGGLKKVEEEKDDEDILLHDEDPDCSHVVHHGWSGIRCTKCPGWFCY